MGKGQGDLTHGKVWKVILSFAFPLLVGNLLLQLYNIVDSIIVGQFVGKEALAAVSASFFIFYFIISFVIGIGSGITVVVSQNYGAKRYDKVQAAFSSFLIFALFAGFFLSVTGVVFSGHFLRLIKIPGDVLPEAIRYFRIYIGGTFFFVAFNSFLSIMRGMGDSKRPMYLVFITTILNVLLDILFIIVFKWGVEGAALATVLSQGTGLCLSTFYVSKRHSLLSMKRKDLTFDRPLFLQGLKIGLPTAVQQSSLALGLLTLLGIVNTFGSDTLTGYGAAGKIEAFIIHAVLTLSSTLAAFCGQNVGAGNLQRVRQGVHFAMGINTLFTLTVYAMILLWGREMIKAFTHDPVVISIGYDYLLIVGATFILHGAMNILNGAMRGSGDTLFAMVSGIILFWVIRIPLAYFMSERMGHKGIWWAISISLVFGFIVTCVYYLSGRWKNRGIV